MKLSKIYARFYKSFNFDDVLKATPNASKRGDWEDFEGDWYPYVEVTVEDGITAIVGANESGKSHLLGAVERAITGKGFSQREILRQRSAITPPAVVQPAPAPKPRALRRKSAPKGSAETPTA